MEESNKCGKVNRPTYRVVLASGNAGKIREMQDCLAPLGIELLSQTDCGVLPAAETGTSFLENALLKAKNCARHTGLPSLADDSGLCVELLKGAPGIYSARYAGPGATNAENIDKLLAALRDVPLVERRAYFWSTLVWAQEDNDPTPIVAEGQLFGHITEQPQGAGGFGYDPVFCPVGYSQTLAQMSLSQKNQISHRSTALRKLQSQLRAVTEKLFEQRA